MISNTRDLDGFELRDDALHQQPAPDGRLRTRSTPTANGRRCSSVNSGDALPLLDLMDDQPLNPPDPPSARTSRLSARHGAADTQFALIGRLGGLAKSARHDSRAGTAAARAGLRAKFMLEADPDGQLSAEERQRRAEALMRLHMSRLALRSAQVRRRRRSTRE